MYVGLDVSKRHPSSMTLSTSFASLLIQLKKELKQIYAFYHSFIISLGGNIHSISTNFTAWEKLRWICVLFRSCCVWQRLHIIYVSLALSLHQSILTAPRLSFSIPFRASSVSWYLFICSFYSHAVPIWKTNKCVYLMYEPSWTVSQSSPSNWLIRSRRLSISKCYEFNSGL